jgi:signal peptidase I
MREWWISFSVGDEDGAETLMAESFFVHVTADLLREGYSVRFQAKGASMYPTIEDGEKVVVEPVAPTQIKWGDIILYRRHEGMIAHRVIGIGSDYDRATTQSSALSLCDVLLLRGDASDFPDEPVEVSRVLGKVVAVERSDRKVQLDTRSAICLSAVRLCAARLRRAMSRRLPRVAYLLRTARALYSERR